MKADAFFNNVIGVAITICALSVMRIQSLKVITILFVLLFAYDIFWVFFSKPLFSENVMVAVAQQNFTQTASKGRLGSYVLIVVMSRIGKPIKKGYNLEFPVIAGVQRYE